MSKCPSLLHELSALRNSSSPCRRSLSASDGLLLPGNGRRSMQQLALARSTDTSADAGQDRSIYSRRRRTTRMTKPLSPTKFVPRRVENYAISSADDLGEGTSAMTELGRRVEALKVAEAEPQQQKPLADASEPLSEDDLLALYEDLLVEPSTQDAPLARASIPAPTQYPQVQTREVVQALYDRIMPTEQEMPPSASLGQTSFAETLRSRRLDQTTQSEPVLEMDTAPPNPLLARIEELVTANAEKAEDVLLARLEQLVVAVEDGQRMVAPTAASISLGMLSEEEWKALVDVYSQDKDGRAVEHVLNLMKRSGVSISDELLCQAISVYANVGDVRSTEHFIATFAPQQPSEAIRDVHIKAHLRRATQIIPTTALDLLHHYEARGLPAAMKTYTRVINALFAVRPATTPDVPPELAAPTQAQAQAWDVFAHMRYAAHPQPDAHLYALMIRACAMPHSPLTLVGSAEPERALDLWREMTDEARLPPSQEAYEAVVRVCARAGEAVYVEEAFRLARAALDGSRNARGESPYRVTGAMCRALLDGAKRIGALGRVRWILAEMVRRTAAATSTNMPKDVTVDEETMLHVFHAYAAYRVPFKRGMAVLVDEQTPASETTESTEAAQSPTQPDPSSVARAPDSGLASESHTIVDGQDEAFARPIPSTSSILPLDVTSPEPAFQSLTPQSRAEVLAEVNFLFAQIMSSHNPDLYSSPAYAHFQHVTPTARLINSYLSVHYRHNSPDACRELWRHVWTEAQTRGIPRNAVSFVEALERCANAQRGRDRDLAQAWSDEIWAEWELHERVWRGSRGGGKLQGMSSRLVERANAARVRLLSVTRQLDRAVAHLRSFVSLYPPRAVRNPLPLLAMRSTRTQLEAPRPLVRLTSAALIPDDHVPPLLLWRDLEVLHQRLVATGDTKGIGLVKYACSAYEGELRRRRDAMMKREKIDVSKQVVLRA